MSHLHTPRKLLHYTKSFNQRNGRFVEQQISVNGMEQDCLLRCLESPGQIGLSLTIHAEAHRVLISQQKLSHLPVDVFMFLSFCCIYFCQCFCSFLIQEFFVDEKCFCSSNSWCDLKGLLKYFSVFLKGYSWLANV